MKIRAVLFDVYNTLLEVGPPPPDLMARWEALWRKWLRRASRLTPAAFSEACAAAIAREHQAAWKCGIPFPEIHWPSILREALPELNRLSPAELDAFIHAQAQTARTLRAMPGAPETLRWLGAARVPLGIASNAQAYTIRELDDAFAGAGLRHTIFQPELCFWSFQNGFSKPDPHVFRILGSRLQARGIPPAQILMVGDRADNDLEPARAQGWQTWQLRSSIPADGAGDFTALGEFLSTRVDG